MQKVKVPFAIPAYRVGDKVPAAEFFSAAAAYIRELENERDDLTEQVENLARELVSVKDELATLEENLQDYYKPRSAYEVRGLRESDF